MRKCFAVTAGLLQALLANDVGQGARAKKESVLAAEIGAEDVRTVSLKSLLLVMSIVAIANGFRCVIHKISVE